MNSEAIPSSEEIFNTLREAIPAGTPNTEVRTVLANLIVWHVMTEGKVDQHNELLSDYFNTILRVYEMQGDDE